MWLREEQGAPGVVWEAVVKLMLQSISNLTAGPAQPTVKSQVLSPTYWPLWNSSSASLPKPQHDFRSTQVHMGMLNMKMFMIVKKG